MPRRRQKRTDTQNSDSFGDEGQPMQKVTHFGAVQINRLLAPDQIEGDDASKYSVTIWTNTLQAQRLLQWPQRRQLFQRALTCLPYSYKIWYMYLIEFIDYCSTRSLLSKDYQQLNKLFERALQKLPKMPRIWLMYCDILQKQHLISKTRAVFNWSFRNLPLTQHQRIWAKFSAWAMKLDNTSTALKVVPRYLKLNPDFKQNYAEFLKERGLLQMYVQVIQDILNDDGYHSRAGKSKDDFYMEMVNAITQYPDQLKSVNGQKIIRQGIAKGQNLGVLWIKLRDYYIRSSQFDKARQCLQEAINTIDNVKDFGIIFDAYCSFEEQMIRALADRNIQKQADVSAQDNVDYEIESRLKKIQSLINRQPYLLLNISIRKDSNNVKTWLKLAQLHKKAGNLDQSLQILKRATKQINAQQVQEGKFSQIWIKLAKLFQQKGQIKLANIFFYESSSISYRMIDDYVAIWTAWVQMLLQQGFQQDALKVVKHVLFRKRSSNQQSQKLIKNIDELLKSHTNIWQLYIDLQITVGTFDSIKLAYQRCKEHKCLTPIMLLNYTNFLWQHDYFQQSFRVFQFAVGNFKWPSLYQIWLAYINKFTSRNNQDGIGIQRTRSLFEKLLRDVPKDKCKIFYFLYAQFEEQYGLYSHAIEIYDKMVQEVPKQERMQTYNVYIAKVAKLLGVTKTRTIFEAALQKLSENQILEMGLKYAQLQTNLAQFDRARGVYTYIGQFTDPRDDSDQIWSKWQNFQLSHGDKQTYKEFLRIKRSVTAKYAMLPPDLQKIQQRIRQGIQ